MWIFINNRATTTKNTLADLFPITVTLPYAYSYSTSNLCHIFHYPYRLAAIKCHFTQQQISTKRPRLSENFHPKVIQCATWVQDQKIELWNNQRERERERERWKIQFKADCQPYKKGHVRHKYLQSLRVIYSSFMKCLGYIN